MEGICAVLATRRSLIAHPVTSIKNIENFGQKTRLINASTEQTA
jgi:hypothetical protein